MTRIAEARARGTAGARPSSRAGPAQSPTCRTSSLNSIRSGSISSKPHVLRQAADVVVRLDLRAAGARCPLSMTSGYSVPWTRNSTLPSLRRPRPRRPRMNSSPMILRLRSGSVDPGQSASRNRSAASTSTSGAEVLAKRLATCSASPVAQQAVVHEDAGQLVADRPVKQRGGDRPSRRRRRARRSTARPDLLADARDRLGDERPRRPFARQPQTLYRKLRMISVPWAVCTTSGWNCTP